MGGRDHSCEVCGRGGFNDPDGSCVCPDPSLSQADLEERVGAAIVEGLTELLRHDPDDIALDPIGGDFVSPKSVGGLLAARALAALSAPEGEDEYAEAMKAGTLYDTERANPAEQQPDQVEAVASAIAIADGYDPNAHPPESWPQWMQRYRKLAAAALEAPAIASRQPVSGGPEVEADLRAREAQIAGLIAQRDEAVRVAVRAIEATYGSGLTPEERDALDARIEALPALSRVPADGEDQRLTPEHLDALSSAALFLDTALTMLVERELFIEGVTEKPVPVVGTNAWFGGAKDLVVTLRALASGEGAEDG